MGADCMSFRYIGSKTRLVSEIVDYVGSPSPGERFVDLFCGTGAVAEAASNVGWDVHVSDHLACAVTMAAGRLMNRNQATFVAMGGYHRVIEHLNSLTGVKGFVWSEYSPASLERVGVERRYFTESNAQKIDAIRQCIELLWEARQITQEEKTLLVADLLSAANKVANIAGTYGCFLSKWQKQAHSDLRLVARHLKDGRFTVTSSCQDASECRVRTQDVVYIDPPYTKRQYASYYHLLETIALGDSPTVAGVSGLRPWEEKASDFCYKARAASAFQNLVQRLPAARILVSYSDAAHVPIGLLVDLLQDEGKVTAIPIAEIGRYRPNRKAVEGGSAVREYIIEVQRIRLQVAA